MRYKQTLACLLAVSGLFSVAAAQEIERPSEKGWIDFKKPILADPVMQHAKETYILYGCAYCHGVDLRVRNGEAADLLHSGIVGADENGNIIGKLLRSGIPQTAKLSPMPQFSDLSDKETADIARWIHYARMEGHFGELMRAKDLQTPDKTAGKAYFDKTCMSCHSIADVKRSLSGAHGTDLKAKALKPALLEETQSFSVAQKDAEGRVKARAKHSSLLENYSTSDVANLLAYLETL